MAVPQTEVLITVDGKEHARHILTPGDYVIGRNPACPIRVDADLVSRPHAKLIGKKDAAGTSHSMRNSIHVATGGAGAALGSTMAGTIMGTPQYTPPPEQARGEIETLD